MLEFLYTGDYGSLPQETDKNDNSSTFSAGHDEDEALLQHVYVNSIADYYDIKVLADLTRSKLWDASQNTSSPMSILEAAKVALSRTGDVALHDMLAEATADDITIYLETDQLAELIGRFGIEILRRVMAVERELRLKIMHLQTERESEEASRKGAEARSAQVIKNINDCATTLKVINECRNCRAVFNCYIEQRDRPFGPLFSLHCAHCRCRH